MPFIRTSSELHLKDAELRVSWDWDSPKESMVLSKSSKQQQWELVSQVPEVLVLLNYEQWPKGHWSFNTSSPLKSYLILLSSLQGLSPCWLSHKPHHIHHSDAVLLPVSQVIHLALEVKTHWCDKLFNAWPSSTVYILGEKKTWTVYRHWNIDLHHYQSLYNWPTLWRQIHCLGL